MKGSILFLLTLVAITVASESEFPKFEIGQFGSITYESENVKAMVADRSYSYLFSYLHTKDRNLSMVHIGSPFGIIFNRHIPDMKISKLQLPKNVNDDLVKSIDSFRVSVVEMYKNNRHHELVRVTPSEVHIKDPSSGLQIVLTRDGHATLRTASYTVFRVTPTKIETQDARGSFYAVNLDDLENNLRAFSAFLAREAKVWIARLITH